MYYIDWTSFAVGLVMGLVGVTILASFTAALFAHYGSESNKRGLSRRHSVRELRGGSLPDAPSATLPAVGRHKERVRRKHADS